MRNNTRQHAKFQVREWWECPFLLKTGIKLLKKSKKAARAAQNPALNPVLNAKNPVFAPLASLRLAARRPP